MTNSLNENSCRLVSSRGILKSCDVYSQTPISSINDLINYPWDRLKNGSTIYVCTSAIGKFAQLLDQIPCSFILVSGDADESAPVDIFQSEIDFLEFINNPKLIHWFAQNAVVSHPKFSPIPIGLDYHTMTQGESSWGPQLSSVEQENQLNDIRNKAAPLPQRLLKAHANFHFLMNTKFGYNRLRAREFFPSDLIDYEPHRVNRQTTWINQSKYVFVASPWGNGLDCHRTWEALCLGCIPIVCTSPIDSLFENLPVYIVKDWPEVTPDALENIAKKFSEQNFDFNRLTLKYWVDKINSKKPQG